MTPAWTLTGLTKRYVGRTRSTFVAVDNVDLSIAPGERVALIGESGSGKTTLVRAGLGLMPIDGGSIALFGEPTASWGAGRWQKARSHAQLLFQDPRAMLHPQLSLGALLRESARLHRPDEPAGPAAEGVLDAVGLSGRSGARPHELSGGEQRRAGIARLLLARPKLVVADELTAGLDAALKASLIELLIARVGPDCAVVFISHDLPVVAWATHRVLVMHQGRIVDAFATADIHNAALQQSLSPATQKLLAAAGFTGVSS